MNAFFESQLAEWEFARRNFEALRRIETKTFDLDGFSIRVQSIRRGSFRRPQRSMRRPSLPENVFYVRKINRPNSGDYPGGTVIGYW